MKLSMRSMIRMSAPKRKFLTKTDSIISEKYAISVHPTTAPIDIAKKVFCGFIPIKRPTMDPTKPPDP